MLELKAFSVFHLTEIIQIVPRLPPAVDGVGDYALRLAQQLRIAHGIHTVFVVCDPRWHPEDSKQQTQGPFLISDLRFPVLLHGFPVHKLQERSAQALLSLLCQLGMPTTVLLQYVGYGYEKRGCPLWLARALQKWTNQKVGSGKQAGIAEFPLSALNISAHPRLVTMFHEISATGPVWSSAFWVSSIQKWIAKFLAESSSHNFTNIHLHSLLLQKLTARNESGFKVLPVFSNVGEPEPLPAWKQRAPQMIVFGSAGWRRQVYTEYRGELEEACQTLRLEGIVDIGSPMEIPPLAIPVSRRGILAPDAASRTMLDARAGFFTCPVNCLGKSGIFAAYAAHGLLPVTQRTNTTENLDGLIFDRHFTIANHLNQLKADCLETLSDGVHEWYQSHSVAAQARHFSKALY